MKLKITIITTLLTLNVAFANTCPTSSNYDHNLWMLLTGNDYNVNASNFDSAAHTTAKNIYCNYGTFPDITQLVSLFGVQKPSGPNWRHDNTTGYTICQMSGRPQDCAF